MADISAIYTRYLCDRCAENQGNNHQTTENNEKEDFNYESSPGTWIGSYDFL